MKASNANRWPRSACWRRRTCTRSRGPRVERATARKSVAARNSDNSAGTGSEHVGVPLPVLSFGAGKCGPGHAEYARTMEVRIPFALLGMFTLPHCAPAGLVMVTTASAALAR